MEASLNCEGGYGKEDSEEKREIFEPQANRNAEFGEGPSGVRSQENFKDASPNRTDQEGGATASEPSEPNARRLFSGCENEVLFQIVRILKLNFVGFLIPIFWFYFCDVKDLYFGMPLDIFTGIWGPLDL